MLQCLTSFTVNAQNFDPSRLVDTDSGGPANNLNVADVNDIHDCTLIFARAVPILLFYAKKNCGRICANNIHP